MTRVRLTAENKEKVRQRILRGAAVLFRHRGYDDVNLDRIMQAAGLTRGAFYAHYRSKAELFADVMRHQHPLLQMLRDRPGPGASDLRAQMMALFEGYLDAKNLDEVFSGCILAALTGDASRSGEAVRKAYERAWNDIVDEMARGQQEVDRSALRCALILASGAISTAAASASTEHQETILNTASQGFVDLLSRAIELETGEGYP